MILIDFKTKKEIKIQNIDELRDFLKYANPLMMRFYKQQIPQFDIKNFGENMEIIRR